ncbi:hypothetical protein AAG747_06805 [Rapidithrix thailandica]|uniref:MarR family transcriptional regulator n=1 Tax=Rapidithrix thailandica TaxID=413964 RepID=A0AAW9S8G0_9BACT
MENIKEIFDKKGPIGYWIKKADSVFTNVTRTTRQNGSFNRLEWQLLNTLHEKKQLALVEVTEFLSSFATDSEIQTVVHRFESENLIQADQQHLSITHKGEQVFDEVFEIQEEIKQNALRGISEEDYCTTVDTLQKMIENLKEYTD